MSDNDLLLDLYRQCISLRYKTGIPSDFECCLKNIVT
jgi:hypothetical protein